MWGIIVNHSYLWVHLKLSGAIFASSRRPYEKSCPNDWRSRGQAIDTWFTPPGNSQVGKSTKNGWFCTLKIWATTPKNEGTLGLCGVYPPGKALLSRWFSGCPVCWGYGRTVPWMVKIGLADHPLALSTFNLTNPMGRSQTLANIF